MDRRFARKDGVVERKVRDSLILVPVGGDTPRIDSLYTLNEMASRVWRHAIQGVTEDQIVAAIASDHDAEEDVVRRDCRRLLDELVAIGALTAVDPKG